MLKVLFFGLILCGLMAFIIGVKQLKTRARQRARADRRARNLAYAKMWDTVMRRRDKPRQITYIAAEPVSRD